VNEWRRTCLFLSIALAADKLMAETDGKRCARGLCQATLELEHWRSVLQKTAFRPPSRARGRSGSVESDQSRATAFPVMSPTAEGIAQTLSSWAAGTLSALPQSTGEALALVRSRRDVDSAGETFESGYPGMFPDAGVADETWRPHLHRGPSGVVSFEWLSPVSPSFEHVSVRETWLCASGALQDLLTRLADEGAQSVPSTEIVAADSRLSRAVVAPLVAFLQVIAEREILSSVNFDS
jgi:hypothetical protein